jgi:hypothetical protein
MRVGDDEIASGRDDARVAALEIGGATSDTYARVREIARWRTTPEAVVALGLGLLVLVVHDVSYLLGQPFWTDEAWVAVSARLPLSALPETTSATPIGWSVMLRAFTLGGDQTSRLMPLAFAGGAVVIAYWFARQLDWRRREASVIAGLLSGFAVLLEPAMLVRNDLKQYTADACMALLVLAVTSRLEREWSRRALVGLSVAVWGGMLLSHTVVFVGVAAFSALCLVQLARRAWDRLIEALVAGAATALLMLGVYEGFDARSVVPGLTTYWNNYYLPVGEGVRASAQFVLSRFDQIHAYFGLGPAWLAVGLVVVGLVTIFRLGRPVTALTAAALWPGLLGASALRRYPFLDLRTSTFLLAVTVVIAAIGVVGLYSLLRDWFRGVVSAALVALAVVVFAFHAQPYAWQRTIPSEDVRDQARYVAAHAKPDDVSVVNLSSNWGFAYYWPIGHPSLRPSAAVLQGYEAYFPDQPRIVVARDRNAAAVDAALAAARALALQHPGARIWLLRTHVAVFEKEAWEAALKRQGLTAKAVGHDGLSIVQVG